MKPMKFDWTLLITILLFQTGFLSAQVQEPSGEDQPNFIVIFADDLGYGDVGSADSDLKLLILTQWRGQAD